VSISANDHLMLMMKMSHVRQYGYRVLLFEALSLNDNNNNIMIIIIVVLRAVAQSRGYAVARSLARTSSSS